MFTFGGTGNTTTNSGGGGWFGGGGGETKRPEGKRVPLQQSMYQAPPTYRQSQSTTHGAPAQQTIDREVKSLTILHSWSPVIWITWPDPETSGRLRVMQIWHLGACTQHALLEIQHSGNGCTPMTHRSQWEIPTEPIAADPVKGVPEDAKLSWNVSLYHTRTGTLREHVERVMNQPEENMMLFGKFREGWASRFNDGRGHRCENPRSIVGGIVFNKPDTALKPSESDDFFTAALKKKLCTPTMTLFYAEQQRTHLYKWAPTTEPDVVLTEAQYCHMLIVGDHKDFEYDSKETAKKRE